MALGFVSQHHQALISVGGIDPKRVFCATALEGLLVRVPTTFHALPDFRPSSDQALFEALEGWPPDGSGLARFDALTGPFSQVNASASAWAQSLDFLRDIKTASKGSAKLSHVWLKAWLANVSLNPEKASGLFSRAAPTSTKTERLIWRSRRILNCLSHAVPLVSKLDNGTQLAFWEALFSDIAKICAPTDTLWASFKEGFDPLTPRAVWLRAVAILGVEASFPGILLPSLVSKSVEAVTLAIQKDGLFQRGSIVSTLSAGADLCMLARIPQIDPVLKSVRQALASVRRSDGALITFGVGQTNFTQLLGLVIGPGDWKPSTLLLESGIAYMSAHNTSVWLRAPQSDHAWGGACEIEAGGVALLTSSGVKPSAVAFFDPAHVDQARCRRRDEPDFVVLEANATLILAGKQVHCVRQIRVAQNGREIVGEDTFRQSKPQIDLKSQDTVIKEICFGIPDNATCSLSKDQCSVLIVTSRQQAWRFRIQGMDITIEMGSDFNAKTSGRGRTQTIVCRRDGMNCSSDLSAVWKLVLEDKV